MTDVFPSPDIDGALAPDAVAFGAADCELFRRYPKAKPFNEAPPADQEAFKSIRNRLKALLARVTSTLKSEVMPGTGVSSQNPSGKTPKDIWVCLLPPNAPHKSFSLQIALVLLKTGAELCCCLGSGHIEKAEPDELAKFNGFFEATRARLADFPPSDRAALEAQLQGKWQFRRAWRQEPGSSDFPSLGAWLDHASSPGPGGASISRNLTPEQLEACGNGIFNELLECAKLFEPLFGHVYGAGGAAPPLTPVPPPAPEPHPAFDRSAALSELITAIASRGFTYEPWQVAAYVTALRTKPFVVLAGVTGTGKSQLPDLVARATGGEPDLLPVRPDWTDSADVLGYCDLQSAFRPGKLLQLCRKADGAQDRHFVCVVDEMNLARVEHYFAEILSRIEGRTRQENGGYATGPLVSHELGGKDAQWAAQGLPANLALVGTVNMDESAHGFSRKVLDRSFTLELSEIDLTAWKDSPVAHESVTTWPVTAWFPRATRLSNLGLIEKVEVELIDRVVKVLGEANTFLVQAQLQVGYRTRDEVALFALHAREVQEHFRTSKGEKVDPIDLALLMKVLPRIAGGGRAVRRLVLQLLGWATDGNAAGDDKKAKVHVESWEKGGRSGTLAESKFPRTAARLCLMYDRLEGEGFTSFWL